MTTAPILCEHCRREARRDAMASSLAEAYLYSVAERSVLETFVGRIIEYASKPGLETAKALGREPDFSANETFLRAYESRLKTSFRTFWKEQERIVLSNIKRTPSIPEDRTPGAFSRLFDTWIFAKKPSDKALASIFGPWVERLMRSAGAREAEIWGLPMEPRPAKEMRASLYDPWRVFNSRVNKFVSKYPFKFSQRLNAVSVDLLREELKEGFKKGENIPTLMKRVNKTYDNWNATRSETIARTESIRASNQGHKASYIASGVVDRMMWVTAGNELACDFCRPLDGAVIAMDGMFNTGIIRDDKPVTTETPPAHPRCRCVVVPVLEGETVSPLGEITHLPGEAPKPPLPIPEIKPPAPEWKPQMTESEALEYIKESAIKDELYHGTSFEYASDIRRLGFDPEACKRALYGNGTYLAASTDTASTYGAKVLKVRANIKNPLRITFKDSAPMYSPQEYSPLIKKVQSFANVSSRELDKNWGRYLQAYAKSKGHDGIFVESLGSPDYIIAFYRHQLITTGSYI